MNQFNKSNYIKEKAKKVWGASPAGSIYAGSFEKGTKKYFETVFTKRMNYECSWLEEIVKFKDFRKRKVLEIGCGAGYDAYLFCKNGADYVGIDIAPENVIVAKDHLSYFGYKPKILEMDVEELSFGKKFDFVYSFGVLHHIPNIRKAVYKINDVLKYGGEFLVILYNKNSFFYWLTIFLYEWILKLGFLKESLEHRLSRIEYTTSNELPLVKVYTKKRMHNLLKECGFNVIDTKIRKFTKEDLPSIPIISKFYRYIPQVVMNFVGDKFGWYICIRTKKCIKD